MTTEATALDWSRVGIRQLMKVKDDEHSMTVGWSDPESFPATVERRAGTERGFLVTIPREEGRRPEVRTGVMIEWGDLILMSSLPAYPRDSVDGHGYYCPEWAIECELQG